MILALIVTVISMLGVLSFTWQGFFSSFFNTIVAGYIYVSVKSLHDVFRDEVEAKFRLSNC